MPSPAIDLVEPIAKAKQNMTDFRALYYSLDSETPAYTTVISDVRNIGTIVDQFATLVTEDFLTCLQMCFPTSLLAQRTATIN